ncbi:MAG: GDSL-type esterase/lipase family protein [Bacteroidia bacterium]
MKSFSPLALILFLALAPGCTRHTKPAEVCNDDPNVNGCFLDWYMQKWNESTVQARIPGGTVFVGTSLTGFFHFHLLRNEGYINRGLPGDFLHDMHLRMNEVLSLRPARIFLEGGVNDIMSTQLYDAIPWYMESMIIQIREQLPQTRIYIQSILPVICHPSILMSNALFNRIIREKNEELRNLARRCHVIFVDLYPLFEKSGEMNPDLTVDGVHLTPYGYLIWEKALIPYLAN